VLSPRFVLSGQFVLLLFLLVFFLLLFLPRLVSLVVLSPRCSANFSSYIIYSYVCSLVCLPRSVSWVILSARYSAFVSSYDFFFCLPRLVS